MKFFYFLLLACLGLFCTPIQAQSTQFSKLTSRDTQINFNNMIEDNKERNILLYANFYGGAGVGVGDFNNDGLEDIYFAGNLVDDKLYLNQGGFKFKDATTEAGIINDGSWSTGVTVADVNNDGLLDIYVSNELYDDQPDLRRNKLYINQGNAVFKEMAKVFKIDNSERTRHAVFFDFDKDGFLDLFVLNQPPNPGSYSEFFGTELLLPKYTSRLYRNIAGKKFIDVTTSAGLNKAGFPNAVSASDLNGDGWIDLYVANDFYAPDFMYMNNKDGTFTNIADKALNHMSFYSMGVDVADINNDDLLDIFTVDMVPEDNFRLKSNMSGMNPAAFWNVVDNGGHYQYMFNSLHLNQGNNSYSDIAQIANVSATDWSWSNLIADFDNDGEKDIYITNGLLREIRNTDASKKVGEYVTETANNWVKNNPNGGDVTIWDILDIDEALAILPSQRLENFMYKNNGNFDFEKVTTEWGLDQPSFSNGAAYADFDNDGDLDLVVNNINDEAFVYKNNAKNNFLRLNLKSRKNKPVFGSKIILKIEGEEQILATTNVRGIYSTSEPIVHFGLKDATKADEIKVIWPDQTVTILQDVAANKEIEIFMEESENSTLKPIEPAYTLFNKVKIEHSLAYKHVENNYDDYHQQILLPHKMSQFGPALAVADVNGDDLEDVFVGGATGYPSVLFLQNKDGHFERIASSAFQVDKDQEDIDAIFMDIDQDGDQDLYVVSGGNEHQKGHKNYLDRVYLNDGSGLFKRSLKSLSIPSFSGSVVVPYDFDNDGDLDVLVGGRHIPHEYPMPASSKLLENQQGKLVDVTKKKAKDLKDIGLVTDAIWTDYNQDGSIDIMLVGEWMGITVLSNKNGVFSKTKIKDFKHTNGWWYSLEQGDFDKDGDLDYIAGNLGLNYKYKTSVDNPFDVYYKDFDDNGSKDIVLGYYNYGKHYPLRGFSCSAQQIPSLKTDIKKYDIFASLEIDDVYGKENLADAKHFKTETFATTFIENLGDGAFKLSNLPTQTQLSSINDMLIKDFDMDGNLDVLLAGNLFVSEIETPRNDAGTGVLLLGDGKLNFKPVSNVNSGFVARKDAKKMKMLQVGSNYLVLVANNNDELQLYKYNVPASVSSK